MVVLEGAQLARIPALEGVFSLWKWACETPGSQRFPLVLAGDEQLGKVVRRRRLESLGSCVYLWSRLDELPR